MDTFKVVISIPATVTHTYYIIAKDEKDAIEKIEELYRLLISKFKCEIIICILDEKGAIMSNLERKKYNIDNNTINIDNNIFIFNSAFVLIPFVKKQRK